MNDHEASISPPGRVTGPRVLNSAVSISDLVISVVQTIASLLSLYYNVWHWGSRECLCDADGSDKYQAATERSANRAFSAC